MVTLRAELEPLPAAEPAEAEAEPAGEDRPEEVTYILSWLAPGDEVYVVGKPEWGRAPADMAGYRDAPLVPLFRGKNVFVSDGSAAEVARHAIYQMVAWTMWSVVVVAVATAHLTGWS